MSLLDGSENRKSPVVTPTDAISSASELRFINISRPGETNDVKTRKIVRTHVAKDFRRKERQRVSGGSLPEKGAVTKSRNAVCFFCGNSMSAADTIRRTIGLTMCQSCLQRWEQRFREKTLFEASESAAAGYADPFSTYPVTSEPFADMLVHYCKCA